MLIGTKLIKVACQSTASFYLNISCVNIPINQSLIVS